MALNFSLPYIQPAPQSRRDVSKAFSSGFNDIQENLQNALNTHKIEKLMPFVEPNARAELQKMKLANEFQQLKNKFYPQETQSEIGLRNAQAGLTGQEANKIKGLLPLELEQQQLKNQWYPKLTQAQINNYNMGGRSGLGVGGREEQMFQSFVSKDNPQLQNDPQKVYEAANALREGKTELSDGTKLNPLSPASKTSLDRLVKGSTTAGTLNSLINAGQAEQEIKVISKYAQEGLKPYGNTYFNKNPEQIMDSFKDDETSQKKLGKFIAAQQLQYEIAQNEIKLAMGQPGITSTQELMQLGQQMIDTKFPRLSYQARQEANRYFIEALQKGYEARKEFGVSPAKATGSGERKQDNSSNDDLSSLSDEELQKIAAGG